jgi:hypothetical protein
MSFTVEIKLMNLLAGMMGQWMSRDLSDRTGNKIPIFASSVLNSVFRMA